MSDFSQPPKPNPYLTIAQIMKQDSDERRERLLVARETARLRAGAASGALSKAEYVEFEAVQKFIRQGLDQFFPTPGNLVRFMLEKARLQKGQRILEPSAGAGHIADKIRAAGFPVDCVELNYSLREFLSKKKHTLVGEDFLSFHPALPYDRIIMNPPFAHNRDAEHVLHAFECLAPGGIIVALVSQGAFFRTGQVCETFRILLHSYTAQSTLLPPETFLQSERPAGVRVYLLEIHRP